MTLKKFISELNNIRDDLKKKMEAQKTHTNTERDVINCSHHNGEPGVETMLRWRWVYCPECGKQLNPPIS